MTQQHETIVIRKPVTLTYDSDSNSLDIKLVEEIERGRIARTVPVAPGVYFDLDDSDNLLSIELLLGSNIKNLKI